MHTETINNATLIKASLDYQPTLKITEVLEKKIRYLCNKFPSTEWSGALFFSYSGNIEDRDLIIECKDLYLMDIGTAGYTEFDMNADVIAYMAENQELLDCQIGLIHSHNQMATFFSGTDTATLKEEGLDRNNFVSLIVNNSGEYTAAITRRFKTMKVIKKVTYDFFSDGEREDIIEPESSSIVIEWFTFKIEKPAMPSFPNLEERINELQYNKENKRRNMEESMYLQKKDYSDFTSPILRKDIMSPLDGLPLFEEDTTSELSLALNIDKDILATVCTRVVTGNILASKYSKEDLKKWSLAMNSRYEERFGGSKEDIKKFEDFLSNYIDFLIWEAVEDLQYSETLIGTDDIHQIAKALATHIVEYLEDLTPNPYLSTIINDLNYYIYD